ncbi:MAG: HAD family hydrolase [Candidatus Zixiibacteriota bacterium]
MTKINTILFDIGWPIIDETEAHRAWNEHLRRRIYAIKGKSVSEAAIKKYEAKAVECYAPSLFSYVIWQLVKPNEDAFYLLRSEFDNFRPFEHYRIQPGIIDVLSKLHGKFKLGFAANQPKVVQDYLNEMGILKFFDSREVSDDIGYSKPDMRMFLKILENLDSKPEETAMIGDRQDNDIVPAKMIGMTAIRINVGPHRDQKIRVPREKPDYIINRMVDLLEIPFIAERLIDKS